ncbi:hypothetical protein RFA42_004435 [Vibrio vulnificus]|uniref:hypothetical protein n=1 Tax=Vibrio vulnificus TaxID=672 RepID=UPI0010291F7D|nr:hypothetical protein [Vibrio vulnificus]EKZ9199836.1 hypothetical protein [Vibrio vulnificus]EKZ9203590.1 hypothetical protein [Vibrio vulnificus]ELV8742179.1 hypothetical protein [Vibrio vulnificus]MCA3971975.1 hypothetical protein [Vibrio vulnificus]MCG6297931.1 hypothetical protein [Vibrio vulnificus]
MPMRNHLSALLFFLLVLLYFSGFYQAVQSSVISAVILTLLLPVLFWRLVKPVDNQAEITRILLLESGFNLLCVVALLHLLPLALMDKAFMVFFVLQAGGFLLVQRRKKAWLSFAVSVCLSFAILVWISQAGQPQVLDSGQLQLFGTAVPWQLKAIYTLWLLQLLLVEYRYILPKVTILLAHLASLTIALQAEDFFHARIVTASHFLFLSLCFDFKNRDWGGREFAVLPSLVAIQKPNIAKWINYTCLGLALLCALHLASGLVIFPQ